MRDDGDAVAFSVTGSYQSRGYGTSVVCGSNNHTHASVSQPYCLLRIERRRTWRLAWDIVLDELIHVQRMNFVSSVERHRFEYRFSLRACNGGTMVVFPPSLHAPRITHTSGGHHPHLGAFRVIPIHASKVHAVPLLPPRQPVQPVFSWPLVAAVVCVVCVALWLVATTAWKSRHETKAKSLNRDHVVAATPVPPRTTTTTIAPQRTEGRATKPLLVKQTTSSVSVPVAARRDRRGPVIDWIDDESEEEEMEKAKEILTTELPEFNDELGWRDFFDSQIYRRDERRHHEAAPPADVTGTSSSHQRTLLTRATGGSDIFYDANSQAGVVSQNLRMAATAPQALTNAQDGAVRHAAPRVVSAAASSRDELQEPPLSMEATAEDFGEFWQM